LDADTNFGASTPTAAAILDGAPPYDLQILRESTQWLLQHLRKSEVPDIPFGVTMEQFESEFGDGKKAPLRRRQGFTWDISNLVSPSII